MRLLILSALIFAAAACSRPEQQAQPPESAQSALQADENSHLLLTVELTPAGLKVLDRTVVEQPLPKLKHAEPQPWVLELRDGRGAQVFKTNIAAQNALRGEFDENGVTNGSHLLLESNVFQIRVPNKKGALVLRGPKKTLSPKDPRHGMSEMDGDEEIELGRANLP